MGVNSGGWLVRQSLEFAQEVRFLWRRTKLFVQRGIEGLEIGAHTEHRREIIGMIN